MRHMWTVVVIALAVVVGACAGNPQAKLQKVKPVEASIEAPAEASNPPQDETRSTARFPAARAAVRARHRGVRRACCCGCWRARNVCPKRGWVPARSRCADREDRASGKSHVLEPLGSIDFHA